MSSAITTPAATETDETPRRGARRGPVIAAIVALLLVLIVAGVAIGIALSGDGDGGRYSFGTVDVSKGTAEIKPAGASSFERLDKGTTVKAGDAVRTATGAGTTIVLGNGSVLRIGGGSGIAFEQRKGSSERPVIRVVTGVAYFRSTPKGDATPVEVTAGSTSITGAPAITAINCGGAGCTVAAVDGNVRVKPASSRSIELGAGSTADLSSQGATEIARSEPTAWIRKNQQADRANDLGKVAKGAAGGTLDEARIDGDWHMTGTVRSSNASNFDVGSPVSFDIDLKAKCPSGPCDVTTTMGRYSGTGTRAHGDLTFKVAGTVQCVNSVTRVITNPDLGPESLKVVAHVSKAALTTRGPVATELAGNADYDADITTPCNNGPTGKQHATMDVTLVGPPVSAR